MIKNSETHTDSLTNVFYLCINNNPAENCFMSLQCLQADCDYHHHLIFDKILVIKDKLTHQHLLLFFGFLH